MNPSFILSAHEHYVTALQFSPDGNALISVGMDRQIIHWSTEDWRQVSSRMAHEHSINTIGFHPSGKVYATGSTDGKIIIWSLPDGTPLHTLSGHRKTVTSVQFSPDGAALASASYDKTLRLWDWSKDINTLTLKGHTGNISSLAFSKDGKQLFSTAIDGEIRRWSLPSSGILLSSHPAHEIAGTSLSRSPDGSLLASGGADGKIKLWSTTDLSQLGEIDLGGRIPNCICFDPDSVRLFASVPHGVLTISAGAGCTTHDWPLKPKGIYGLDISPDGRWLAAGAADKKVYIWDLYSANCE